MTWWNDLASYLASDAARPVIVTAVLVAVAIVVSGVISAVIARAAVAGMLERGERAQRTAAIASLVDASTEASVWNSLTPGEQVLSDRAVGQADIHVRMMPVRGAKLAADWASHQLAEMKRASSTFGYQLEPAVVEFRDRLLEWQRHPRRARRIFADDLERWTFQGTPEERALQAQQDAWVAQQHHERFTAPRDASTATDRRERAGRGETRDVPADGVPRTEPMRTQPAPRDRDGDRDRASGDGGSRPQRRVDADTQRLMDDVDRLDRPRPDVDGQSPEPVGASSGRGEDDRG